MYSCIEAYYYNAYRQARRGKMSKILFVDDERLIREGISDLINWKQISGENLRLAENASAALEYLEKELCDIVITDIYMQDINGIELAKRIKAKWPGVIVILLSAYEDFEYAKEAIEIGVFKYLLKPVIPEELEMAVQEALSKVRNNLEHKNKIENSEKMISQYKEQMKKTIWKDIAYGNIRSFCDMANRFRQLDMEIVISGLCVVVFEMNEHVSGMISLEETEMIAKKYFRGYVNVIYMGGLTVIILEKQPLAAEVHFFREDIEKIVNNHIYIGIGTFVADIFSLPETIKAAKYKLEKEKMDNIEEIDQLVLNSIKMIREEIHNIDFSINKIATTLHVTPAYFSRVFKEKMGMTCIEYIKKSRVDFAKELLLNTDLSNQEISEKIGYASVYYFNQQFKKITGETPGHFRKRGRGKDV